MKVTRGQIFRRGLDNCCPNCGGKTLFKAGSLFRMNSYCPSCGFRFEGTDGGEGFYLRSTSLNFGVTVVGFLFPVLLLAFTRKISVPVAEGLAIAGVFAVPVLFYRSSRSWGLMNYYIFAPDELPANMPAAQAAKVVGPSSVQTARKHDAKSDHPKKRD